MQSDFSEHLNTRAISKVIGWNLSQQTFVLLKTSWRRLEYVFHFRLQKSSSRRLEDILIKTNIFALIIRLQKTSSRPLGQDQFIRLGHTSSRRLAKTFSRFLEDVFQRCLQDVFKTYHQVKLFLLIRLRGIFNTLLRRTTKTVIYRRICLGHTSEKYMVSVQNLQEL